jgi:hypothetical protein
MKILFAFFLAILIFGIQWFFLFEERYKNITTILLLFGGFTLGLVIGYLYGIL